jgi:hypothetical protein
MRDQLVNLMVKIDKIKSTTEIKEAIAKIILDYEYAETKTANTTEIEINVAGKNCCMPSVCVSNCGACDADVQTNLSLPEPKKMLYYYVNIMYI